MVVVAGEGNLFEIVLALGAAGSFTGLLNSGQQECDQDRDNRDHNEQFDQRESTPICSLQAASRLFHRKFSSDKRKNNAINERSTIE
jgi:hypothetical protein